MRLPSPIHLRRKKHFRRTVVGTASYGGMGNLATGGKSKLLGGQITSTQKAIDDNKNSFNTGGTLTTNDLQNQASFNASSVGLSIGSGVSLDGKLTPQGTSAGIGKDDGDASSTTQAAISGIAGNTAARPAKAGGQHAAVPDGSGVYRP